MVDAVKRAKLAHELETSIEAVGRYQAALNVSSEAAAAIYQTLADQMTPAGFTTPDAVAAARRSVAAVARELTGFNRATREWLSVLDRTILALEPPRRSRLP